MKGARLLGTLSGRSARNFSGARVNDAILRENILNASLPHVNSLGWSNEAIAQGVLDLGYSAQVHTVITKGPVELVEKFIEKKRAFVSEKMKLYLSGKECSDSADVRSPSMEAFHVVVDTKEVSNSNKDSTDNINNIPTPPAAPVRRSRADILNKAISLHLEYTYPHLGKWPGAVALLLEPSHVPNTIRLVRANIEDIVDFASIETSRLDWYTERFGLLAVICSAEMMLMQDKTENFSETRSVDYYYSCLFPVIYSVSRFFVYCVVIFSRDQWVTMNQ